MSSTFLNVRTSYVTISRNSNIDDRSSISSFCCCWKLRKYWSDSLTDGIYDKLIFPILFDVSIWRYFVPVRKLYEVTLLNLLSGYRFHVFALFQEESPIYYVTRPINIRWKPSNPVIDIQACSLACNLCRWYLEIVQLLNSIHKGPTGRNEITTADET